MEQKDNKINGIDAVKYFKCGDYHGWKKGINYNAEETCFGVYMYLIENTLGLYYKEKEYLEHPYVQSQIDTIRANIDQYVMNNCIDYNNKEVKFSREHFQEKFKDFVIPHSVLPLYASSNLMPYAVQYILMQHGIQLADKNTLLNSNDMSIALNGAKFTTNNSPVYTSETKKSIDEKRMEYEQNKQ